jgi:pimeloyl-ACP methyl ester carboxylesterase/tetratricopeptide (TPR) repeat protein
MFAKKTIRQHALAALAGLAVATGAAAQSPVSAPAPAAATHKHYDVAPQATQPGPTGALAPRLQKLGAHTFPVSTTNREAQRFINQGVNLACAFNHAEARRAFREAARLDPTLAMAYWGQALVLGPNINALMEPNEEPHAYEMVQKAKTLAVKATPRERALIDALEKRYSGKAEDRTANDAAYAAAMRAVHARFPQDLDIATFYVESMMDLRPWGYWMPDGRPHEGTAEIVALTEDVIRRNPTHPGALHMYVHLVEATSTPERAEKAADTLLTLMPAAGHMIHMASHIYQRVGRYADAIRSNQLAIEADEDYITQCRAQGLYPMAYYPHNIHFLWFAATADAQSKVAMDAAAKVAAKIPDAALAEMPLLAGFRVVPYWANVRFGRWAAILAEPAPPASNVFLTGAWHFARGTALVATGKVAEADEALRALEALMDRKELDAPLFSPNTGRAILGIAPKVLAGEIAAAKGEFDRAIAALEQGVRLEDALVYTEPSEWAYPVRQALGAVLLQAGRAAEAETVYWEDLKRNRENPWALTGLVQALSAQKKDALAAVVEVRRVKAMARADTTLPASRFGRTGAASTTGTPGAAASGAAPLPSTVTLANGVTIPYVAHGSATGVPVILLHGVTDSWRSFEHVLPHLPESIRAFALTQRGHGDASRPAEYTYAALADDVALFMDALRIPSAIVVGHSMGSLVAQKFALEHPARTRGLVLVGAFHTVKGHPDVEALWNDVLATLKDPVDPAFVRSFQESTVVRPLPPGHMDAFVGESLKVPARVWRALFSEFRQTDFSEQLGRIATPTLIVAPGRDPFSRRQERDALAAAIQGATVLDYPEAGHAIHWEDPGALARDIATFVTRVSAHSASAARR